MNIEIVIHRDGSTLIDSCPEIPRGQAFMNTKTGEVKTMGTFDINITDAALEDPCWGEEN
jgi:hypothetical protein